MEMMSLHQLVKVFKSYTSHFHCVYKLYFIAKCDNVTLQYGDCHPSCQGAVGDSIKIVCHDGVTYEMNCIANGTTVTWNISIPQCSGKILASLI